MSILQLIEDVRFPDLYEVRRTFADDGIRDVARATRDALACSSLASVLPRNGEIAVAVGSRGIAALPEIVAAVVGWFAEQGTRPFIVPSMGSHGGATAEGQLKVLRELGVTEETAGCPIRSDMETIELGVLDNGLPVYMDKNAGKADGIFVVNRVKPHTGFTGKHESGLVKMLAIGLGKQRGADSCHTLGYAHFPSVMPRMAHAIFEKAPVLGGLAIVENAFDRACLIEAVLRDNFIGRDAALLEYAKKRIPLLPLQTLDVLLMNRMGKEISGAGMDPNVTGRTPTPYKTCELHATRIGVLRLTPASKGNATGIGLVDSVPRSLYDSVNFDATYANVITSTGLSAAFVPVVMPTDKSVLQCLIKTAACGQRIPRLVYLRDTLTLDRFWVSEPVAAELRSRSDCTVATKSGAFVFDSADSLIAPDWR